MTPTELMAHIARVFDGLGVPYAVTGSMASMYYGEGRMTNDVDVVADLPMACISALVAALPEDEFYVSEDAIRSAIEHRGQFNIIHPTSGLKIDVILPKDLPHDRQQLTRAQPVAHLTGSRVMFCASEDVIIKKLWFYQMGESDKHLRDIASMLKISGSHIDRAYIADWTAKLGLTSIWTEMCARVPEEGQK